MVNRDTIERFTRLLRQYLKHLRQLAEVPDDRFLADPHLIGSARYYLTVSIEACLDIANHLIASEGLRSPKDYKDAFRVLHEAGVLSGELSARMQALAGLRNLLVHVYWDVDDALIHQSLRTELDDFEQYALAILTHLESSIST
ncbi:MAG TPA: DUF86 domain-containing protein [Thermoflexia bacterium]|jgi:uncharacterized protein YutE (UPF0331/DUF86 family)|nr:DUF86 domain-containing protein [Thermoflexia bacterium]